MSRTNRKITIPVSIGYGLTDIMGGGAFAVIGAWLLFFYTTFVGLSPVEAASIVAIARIVDAIVSCSWAALPTTSIKTRWVNGLVVGASSC